MIHTLTGTKESKNLAVQTTKTNGKVTEKTWTDGAGNTVRTMAGGLYTDQVFTQDGKEIASISLGNSTKGDGKISLNLYDKEGRTTHTITNPVIGTDNSIKTGKDTVVQKTSYDANGNESTVTDGNGNTTKYTYDDQSRVTEVSRENGSQTVSSTITYDTSDEGKTTTSVKDANGHINKEVANQAGLTESTTDEGDEGEKITTVYTYDSDGNKIQETYADGGYKTFDYDRKNRLIRKRTF